MKIIAYIERQLLGDTRFAESEYRQAVKHATEVTEAYLRSVKLEELYASNITEFRKEYEEAQRSISIFSANLTKAQHIVKVTEDKLQNVNTLNRELEYLKTLIPEQQ